MNSPISVHVSIRISKRFEEFLWMCLAIAMMCAVLWELKDFFIELVQMYYDRISLLFGS